MIVPYDDGVSVPDRAPLTAGDLLTLTELRALRGTSALRGAGLVLHAWAVIAGAMALYLARPSWLTLAVAVAVIGARQLGLAVLMHEAAHWLLFPGQAASTRVGSWLCAWPLGGDLRAYRRRHHRHHRHTRQADDPDLALATARPVTRTAFWLGVARDLTGLTACARVARWRPRRAEASRLAGPLAVNAVLFTGLTALGHWSLYLLLWVLPLATWYQMVGRLRDLAEHGLVADDHDPLRNARTTAAGPLARAFLAPYWVNHHLEHHLLVFVPCWRLRDAHRLLLGKGHGPRMELASGYAGLVRRATS
jgi:fatty acid desaturase